MRVTRVESISHQKLDISPKAQLEALAKSHHVSVEELIHSAKAAGNGALPYQIRALNLVKRMEKTNE